MVARYPLSNSLRVIGQVLEQRRLDLFDLEYSDTKVFVQCGGPTPPYLDLVELSYSLAEIKDLDAQARASRSASHTLVSFDSLPEIFRAIGRRIDDQDGQLLRVCNSVFPSSQDSITIEYRTRDKRRHVEELFVVAVRDHAMRMYKKRAQRFAH